MSMTEAEIRRIVSDTVKETLTAIGLDVSGADSIIAAQVDLAYLRRSRRGAEEVGRWVRRAAVAAFGSGVLWMLWEGFKIAVTAKVGLP